MFFVFGGIQELDAFVIVFVLGVNFGFWVVYLFLIGSILGRSKISSLIESEHLNFEE